MGVQCLGPLYNVSVNSTATVPGILKPIYYERNSKAEVYRAIDETSATHAYTRVLCYYHVDRKYSQPPRFSRDILLLGERYIIIIYLNMIKYI